MPTRLIECVRGKMIHMALLIYSHKPRRAGMRSSAQRRIDLRTFSWARLPEAIFSMRYPGRHRSTRRPEDSAGTAMLIREPTQEECRDSRAGLTPDRFFPRRSRCLASWRRPHIKEGGAPGAARD